MGTTEHGNSWIFLFLYYRRFFIYYAILAGFFFPLGFDEIWAYGVSGLHFGRGTAGPHA